MRLLAAAFLSLFLASSARAAEDVTAPVIEHTPVSRIERGQKFVEVFAKITDESKFFPQLFFRYGSTGEYQKPLDMKAVKGQKNKWGAAAPVKGDVLEYYLEAYDEAGNGPGRSGDPEKPHHVDTTGDSGPVAAAPSPKQVEAPPAEPPKRTPPPAATAQAQSSGRTWTWITGGVGLGLLTGGLLTGLAVKTADDAYTKRLTDPTSSYPSLQAQYDANKSLGTKATILTIGGGVLLAASVALFFIEAPAAPAPEKRRRDDFGKGDEKDHGISVAVAPLQGGGAVAMQGSF